MCGNGGLTWSEIDLDAGGIKLDRATWRKRGRVIPLPPWARAALYDYRCHPRRRTSCIKASEGRVFVHVAPLGRVPMHDRWFQIHVATVGRMAGLNYTMTPHTLRHAASRGIRDFTSPAHAQAVLGHSPTSVRTTQLYTAPDRHLRVAASRHPILDDIEGHATEL